MKKLHIENFKCLKDFEIIDLKRVNLFTGRNNTGKSTLLEAISVFLTSGNMQWLYKLLFERGELKVDSNKLLLEDNIKLIASLFNGRDLLSLKEKSINIQTETESINLKLVSFIEQDQYKDIDGQNVFLGSIKVPLGPFDGINSSGLEIKLSKNNSFDSRIVSLVNNPFKDVLDNGKVRIFQYINTSGDNYLMPASLWDKITLTEKENNVIEALQIVEPLIERISFVGENSNGGFRYPVVKIVNDDKKYPLKSMGEGINRIMNIILALVNSENGYLLIDEFENGLHYSVQEKLWEVIFKTAEKLNVQVFATTHSTDTINSFAKVIGKEKNHEGRLYRMANIKDKIKAYNFSKEEIIRAANQQINLR